MKQTPNESFRKAHRNTRRENFAASQRLEGILTPATVASPPMALDLDHLRPSIASLCRRYRVRKLEAFGSATRPDFDASRSDVDLMVEFADSDPAGAVDRYFGLHEALESLMGHPVDLVVRSAVRNPYFLQTADRDTVNLYGP